MSIRVDDEELDRALVAMAPDALLVVDARGLIVLANPSAQTLFGYGATQLIGEPIDRLIPDATPFKHPQHTERYVAEPQDESPGIALLARRRDGSTFPAEVTVSTVGQGEAGVLVCTAVRDISDRVTLEAQFVALLDATPDAIVAADRDGTIKVVNRYAELMFGFDRAELLGQKIERLVPALASEMRFAQRQADALDPQPRHVPSGMELSARRKDGTEFPVDLSLSSIETRDGLLISVAVRDMTERVDAEHERALIVEGLHRARLIQMQRLETVGQLAGGIAHDFNNQLAVILNYADFVHEKLPDGELRHDVEEIQRAATHAADLTRQLLIFARREVTKQTLLDLNGVVARPRARRALARGPAGPARDVHVRRQPWQSHHRHRSIPSEAVLAAAAARRGRASPSAVRARASGDRHVITVLVVDDTEQVVTMTTRVLERHGLHCRGARDVREALAIARDEPPCVVLLDLALGDESGFDLHKELRAEGETDPAIIFVTSRRDQFFHMLPVLGPSDDWIIKPWDATELVARVHLALRRTKHGAEASRALLPEMPPTDRV